MISTRRKCCRSSPAIGMEEEARAYRDTVIDRFRNPFLDHRLAEIFTNHEAKKQRRFGGLIELAEANGLRGGEPRLRAALASRTKAPFQPIGMTIRHLAKHDPDVRSCK